MYYQQEISFAPDEILEYLRKSRSDDPILTVAEVLARHEAILSDWCSRNLSDAIPAENVYREVVSGETIDDRPEMLQVLKRIESPKIKAILVVEVQRLSRGDLEDAGRLIKLLRYTDTVVITPQKTYDLKDEYDRDIFERELKRGNEYLEYQKKIMSRGRLLSVQQGNFIGSIPPYGYEKIFIQEGKRKAPTLKIKENEADVVRMIYDMYVNQNMGYAKIARRLDALHINPPKGDHWSPLGLREMLANVHYTGRVKWNWRKIVNIVKNGEVVKTRPKSKGNEYLVFEGKHEAIISDELFEAAAKKLGKNPRATALHEVRNPFAGILYCQCGRAMSLRYYKRNGVEVCAPRLLCDNQPICGTASCLYDDIVFRVRNILQESIRNIEIHIKNADSGPIEQQTILIQSLRTQLARLEEKEVSQWEKYSEDGMPKEIFEKLNAKVLREKENVRLALRTASDSLAQRKNYEERLLTFTAALESLEDSDISAAEKNRLLKSCIEKITYRREKTSMPIELNVTLHL